jgi:hypothetical protein
MQIKTPQVKLALRVEEAVIEDDTLVMKGLAGFLPCEARMTAPEVRHLLGLLFRRDTLRWTLDALLHKLPPSPTPPDPKPG